MNCKYPAIQVKLVAESGEHIGGIIHDALQFSKDMKVKVIVETCKGDLYISPDDTREEIVDQWTELGKAG